MASKRMIRVNELLKRELAAYLYRLTHDGNLDLAAITVTQVSTAPNLRTAQVYISIRDHKLEREEMLNAIREHRLEMQQHINKTLHLKYTPQLTFKQDESIEKGDHVLHLISELEEKYGEPPDETTDPESEQSEP